MRTASTVLPPDPTSARVCRRFLTTTLSDWGADSCADDAVLLVSELVTNAVLHAGTEIEVQINLDRDLLRVEVRDGNPLLPSVRRYSTLSGTGRGLALVANTAADWDAERLPGGGKRIWFELAAGNG